MKQFILRTKAENLKHIPNTEYINECCRYCDSVLELIKPAVSRKMNVDPDEIEIGQEDWGWYLEFQSGAAFYELDISYQGESGENEYEFGTIVEAYKKRKGLFFDRKLEADEECRKFAELVESIAKENDFEIFPE